MHNDDVTPTYPKYKVKLPPRDLHAEALMKFIWEAERTWRLPEYVPYEEVGPYRHELDVLVERLAKNSMEQFRTARDHIYRNNDKIGFVAATMPKPEEGKRDPRLIEDAMGIKRFRVWRHNDFKQLPRMEWLVPDILSKQASSLLYGDSNTGKTFVMLDLALSLAYGQSWHGRQVEPRTVLYISAEGREGFYDRVRAWQKYHGVEETHRIYYICDVVNLISEMDVLRQTIDEMPRTPELIVLDTFSMTSGGINENVNSEVAKYLACTNILKIEYNCHVSIVHHSGKNGDYRGAAAFRGNVDTMMKLIRTEDRDLVKLSCEKQRDRAPFADMHLQLKVVELEYDARTHYTATSCVAVPTTIN